MRKRQPEKGEAPVIGPTEASSQTPPAIKPKERHVNDNSSTPSVEAEQTRRPQSAHKTESAARRILTDRIPETPEIHIAKDRVVAGLEATWEADALIRQGLRTTAELAVDEDVHEQKLLLRGLLARMLQLNSSVMSILGEDGVSTAQLKTVVQGTEVIH
jgi:hypothetical protein